MSKVEFLTYINFMVNRYVERRSKVDKLTEKVFNFCTKSLNEKLYYYYYSKKHGKTTNYYTNVPCLRWVYQSFITI